MNATGSKPANAPQKYPSAPESSGTRKKLSPKRWYHLTVFPKAALIFFLVMAIPVAVILLYVSQRNHTLIVKSIDQVVPHVVGFVEEITQHQIHDYDVIVDSANRDMDEYLQGMIVQMTQSYRHSQESLNEGIFETISADVRNALDGRFAIDNDALQQELMQIFSAGLLTYGTALEKSVARIAEEERGSVLTTLSTSLQRTRMQVRKHSFDQEESLHETVNEFVTDSMHATAGTISARTRLTILPMIFVVGVISTGMGLLVAGYVIRPIRRMTEAASQIARGEVEHDIPSIHSHDEIGQLSRSFQDMAAYIRRMVTAAQQIATGDFAGDITPLSEHDALGTAFQQMIGYLRELSALATAISYGDVSQRTPLKSDSDVLGQAIHRMTDYLQGIARVARTIAGGDLSEQVSPQSDEDVLGNAFDDMIVKLREVVVRIRADATTLVAMSQESHIRAREEAESVEKISLSVEETSSAMTQMAMSIGEVHNNMQGLASFVGETSSSIEEMTSSIRHIVRHSEQLTSASEETSASIEEISASLQQFAKTAQHSKRLSDTARQDAINGREAVEKMIQGMLAIQAMASETAEAIRSLNDRTESIQDILSVIKDISEHTSLLAINASIIAKKAGEHGRGFTVIADKVRKLAERSNSSAKEIVLIIRAVRKEAAHAVAVVSQGHERVQDGVKLAELAGQALEKIISGANESSSVISMIADTTGEQTNISRHIMESMDQVLEMVEHIKTATEEQEKSSAYIMTQGEQILLASEQVKAATSEQADVVKHVTLTMDDVRNLIEMTAGRANDSARAASSLAEHAGTLQQMVSQFTMAY